MSSLTTILSLRKPDGPDNVSHTLDLNGNWDLVDALFNTSTGHKHTGAGTNGPIVVIDETQVVYDATEAATLDTLSGASHLINNMNRIRYWLTQISGQSLGTVTTSLNTHATSFHATAFAAPNTVVLGSAAANGAATTIIRSDATIAAFDTTPPTVSAVGDAAAVGSIAFAARRDHLHGREAFAIAGSSAVGDSAATGSNTTISRSDHRHGREAFATPGSSAVGDVAAAGAATTISRSDNLHG